MKDSVRCWSDGSVQPVLPVIDPDRFPIDRNAIRALTISWLWIGFLYPVLHGDTTPIDTRFLKKNNCIEGDNTARR